MVDFASNPVLLSDNYSALYTQDNVDFDDLAKFHEPPYPIRSFCLYEAKHVPKPNKFIRRTWQSMSILMGYNLYAMQYGPAAVLAFLQLPLIIASLSDIKINRKIITKMELEPCGRLVTITVLEGSPFMISTEHINTYSPGLFKKLYLEN